MLSVIIPHIKHASSLICNDLLSSVFSGNHHKLIFSCFWRHLKRASEYQFPALATLIYVDWLPTGQWSAVSSTVYMRGSQITLCRHSSLVDSSNLEMAEALSRCLQLLFNYWPDVCGVSHLTSAWLPAITARWWCQGCESTTEWLGLDISSTMLYLRQCCLSSYPT